MELKFALLTVIEWYTLTCPNVNALKSNSHWG